MLFLASTAYADYAKGSSGPEVIQIQERLQSLGYKDAIPTGQFGDDTELAVQQFQTANNLTPDGVVGEYTYSRLMGRSIYTSSRSLTEGVRVVIGNALSHLGTPYVFGGTSSYGLDCSGFTQLAFAESRIAIPRTADSQYYANDKVARDDLSPGDLVFFETYESGPSHCGIYLGNNRFIHAGSSTGVAIASLDNSYWASCYYGAARVIK